MENRNNFTIVGYIWGYVGIMDKKMETIILIRRAGANKRIGSLNKDPQQPYEGSPNSEYLFGGPHNKEYSIVGSILGYPYLRNRPYDSHRVQSLGLG